MSWSRAGGPRGKSGSYGDRGVTATEYIGMVVVVVAVMAVLAGTLLPVGIANTIRDAICRALGGSCGTGGGPDTAMGPNARYRPGSCQAHVEASTQGGAVKASFRSLGLELGADYGFEEATYWVNRDVNKDGKIDKNDRETRLTFTDAASVQAKVEPKARFKIGDVGKDKVELAAGIEVAKGDTWVFDSPEEAEQFRDDLSKYKTLDRVNDVSNLSPLVGTATEVGSWFGKGPKAEEDRLKERIDEQLGRRHITTGRISLTGNAQAGMQFGPGINSSDDGSGGSGGSGSSGQRDGDDDGSDGSGGGDEALELPSVGAEAGIKVEMSRDAIWTKDDVNGTKSYTFQAMHAGSVYGKAEAGVAEAGGEAKLGRTGAITMTVDQKTGKLKAITMTQTIEKKLEGGAGLKDGVANGGKKGDGSAGVTAGGTDVEVITTSLAFGPEMTKAKTDELTQGMLAGGATNAFQYLFTNAPTPTKDPGQGDPWGHLLYEKGVVSKIEYKDVTDSQETGLDINLGIAGVGGSYNRSSSETTLTNAEFLGAPEGGTRSYVPFNHCVN